MAPPTPQALVVVRRLGVVINALIALLALGSGLVVTQLAWQGRVLTLLFGLFWLGVVVLSVRATAVRAVASRVRTGDWDGRPATIVDLRRDPMLRFLYVSGGFGLFLAVAMALAIGAGSSAWVVCAVLAVFLLSVALEIVLALRRRPQVALTSDGLGVRDWSTEQWIAWDAVAHVEASMPGGQPAIRITGQSSLVGQRLLWRLARRSSPGVIEIEASAVEPHESSLFDAISRYRDGAVHRDEPGTPAGLEQLRAP